MVGLARGHSAIDRWAPMFHDEDGDALTITVTVPNLPSNVYLYPTYPLVQPAGALEEPTSGLGTGILFFRGQAAGE